MRRVFLLPSIMPDDAVDAGITGPMGPIEPVAISVWSSDEVSWVWELIGKLCYNLGCFVCMFAR